MSTDSAPFYWLVCDGCGVKSTEDDEYVAWQEERQAREHAEDVEWWVRYIIAGGQTPRWMCLMDLCPECRPLDGDGDVEWERP